MNIIELITLEALKFMEKRKKVEDKRKKEMLSTVNKMYDEILKTIRSLDNISVSTIPQFVNNEIKPIIDEYKNIQKNYVDSFIRDDYGVGNETGQKYLELSNEELMPLDKKDSQLEEVLVALLLYAERIIDSIHDDLNNNLIKDMTSIYITNKNYRDYTAEKEIKTEDNSTINTILAGSIITRYINSTFKNSTIRTDLTAKNETNRALNHGLLMAYIINKRNNRNFSNLMVKWIDVKDERECKYCRDAANGGDEGNGVYGIDEITPPPIHSRCRCIIIPYLSRWEV